MRPSAAPLNSRTVDSRAASATFASGKKWWSIIAAVHPWGICSGRTSAACRPVMPRIPTRSIVLRHALRNAAGPALTVLSLEFLTMLGGALIIEKVFALPGFGSYAFNASLQGDIPVVMGITLFSVLLVVIVNLAVDLANGWLNPKARLT